MLSKKIEFFSLSSNLVLRRIQICRLLWCAHSFCLNQKYPFWVNLVQKIKIVSLSWNLVFRLIEISRIQWWCWLFQFLTGNTVFGQFWSKTQNCLFKVKFDTKTKWSMLNSVVVFTFLFKVIFGKFCPKHSFGILLLPDWSPSRLLAETWGQWLFLLVVRF